MPKPVHISCTISPRRPVKPFETLTYTASHHPSSVAVSYVFDHGDGTLDPGRVSKAYYAAPGEYHVVLRWSLAGLHGATPCGVVRVVDVTPTPTPTPTPTGPVQISCTIAPRRPVVPYEPLTFTAHQTPDNVAVSYVFDHGDGTLDPRPVSQAYYAAPGTYTVTLSWAYAGRNGSTPCGVVIVLGPVFDASDYVGKVRHTAEAIATQKGFVVRVTRVDDMVFPGTTDYRTDRVNFEIDDNVVTVATLG